MRGIEAELRKQLFDSKILRGDFEHAIKKRARVNRCMGHIAPHQENAARTETANTGKSALF
jgi:hypothetical protein